MSKFMITTIGNEKGEVVTKAYTVRFKENFPTEKELINFSNKHPNEVIMTTIRLSAKLSEDEIIESLISKNIYNKDNWIPISVGKPKKASNYIVTIMLKKEYFTSDHVDDPNTKLAVKIEYFDPEYDVTVKYWEENVLAWMEAPEEYHPTEDIVGELINERD